METKILTIHDIDKAATLLQKGELVAFPTETVYGLGADARQSEAVGKVYSAKGRPSDNPLIIHVSDPKQIEEFVMEISDTARQLMTRFWPGPLTIILTLKEESGLPSNVTGGLGTAAFRMPNNESTLALINASGTVLVGPSANTSGKPSPTTADHVYHDLHGRIAGILDDGPCEVGIESTVIDVSDSDRTPLILRPGAITQEELADEIGEVSVDQHILSESEAPKAPGMKYKHYSPETPVEMVDYQLNNWELAIQHPNRQKIGILANDSIITAFGEGLSCYSLTKNNVVEEAMTHLFSGLRYLDTLDLDVILVQTFPEEDRGIAYMNRLKKAANQTYVDVDFK